MNKVIAPFLSGTHNLLDPEIIPKDAAQDSLGFVTKDGRVILAGGRQALGAEGTVGTTTGIHKGYKTTGATVLYYKNGTKIQYYDGSAWQDCITGLDADDEYVFANYSSLAGAFTFVNGPAAYYKIVNANPGSPINIYDSTKNFYGYIIMDRGRTLLWNREKDKTGLYGSWIDRQDSTVYTTVTNEAIGSSGSTVYTGTLAFKAGSSYRNCFGVLFDATTGAGTETFTDNYDGTLTSDKGGSGTINYATGAYNITFNAVTTGAVTSDYQYENSTVHGVADFSKSATRVAGEGFLFPQDEGGDAILNVLIGQDGNYYSMKSQSAYILALEPSDTDAINEVYRKDLGLPYFRAAVSTNTGIFFINTANPTKPEMTILQRSKISGNVEPIILFNHFKFGNYTYDTAGFSTYDRWFLVFCKSEGATNNDTILMCDSKNKTVDAIPYNGRLAIQDGAHLYMASSVSRSVYEIFTGYDDMGLAIEAFWEGKDDVINDGLLAKLRKLRFKGFIDPDQVVEVYTNIDNAGYSLVGTIRGDASYVNYSESQAIGSHFVGEAQVGGDDIVNAYGYYMEIKLRTGKFRKISVKLVPTGIGYFDFDQITFWDVLGYEDRMPKSYRQKQNVSLDGSEVDQ